MNKRDFTTVRLAQGEMHIYDFGGVKQEDAMVFSSSR